MKKPAKPFVPVPVGTQRRKHQRQLARMQHWQPKTFSQQRQAHRAAQQKAAAHHHVATVKKASKARGWSPDSTVALCTARAFAETLRLALGVAVSDSAVLDVYWATAGDADSGASIVATAEAIDELTGAGAWRRLVLKPQSQLRPLGRCPATRWDWPDFARAFGDLAPVPSCGLPPARPLILGLSLPEPHTVCVDPDGGWWSWGEPFDPLEWPGLIIEEAWAVQWRP